MRMDRSAEKLRAELIANQGRELTPREKAAQAEIREWSKGFAQRPIILSNGQPARQDPAIVAIRDGKPQAGGKVRAGGFKGKSNEEVAAASEPEFVKLTKSVGMTPEEAIKFTKLFRPPEK
jgi:hypothetical protein